jgi:hypothetical protein
MLRIFFKSLMTLLVFILLTLVTQVGGIIFLLFKFSFAFAKKKLSYPYKIFIFIAVYTILTFTLIPFLASKYGRVPLPYFASKEIPLKPLNFAFCLLNRNYVRPQLKKVLVETAQKMNKIYPHTIICYLDTGFPFIDRFPLLPHLSHHDGKKADLAFCYLNSSTREAILDNAPSWTGYGVFEAPKKGENNRTLACKKQGYWQYDFAKYIGFSLSSEMTLDEVRTKRLLQLLITAPSIQMILIEPHLKSRLGISSNKVRFQGCHSVRHDDHIHVQL